MKVYQGIIRRKTLSYVNIYKYLYIHIFIISFLLSLHLSLTQKGLKPIKHVKKL